MAARTNIPEFNDVAKKHTVEALEAKVDKCYSSEKYKEFSEEVEFIALKQLGSDEAHKVIRSYVDARVQAKLNDNAWKNKTFWIPTSIAAVAAAGAILALLK